VSDTDHPSPSPDAGTVERVVSLAPNATATLSAMDAAEPLVGVTHHCEVDAAEPVGGWLTPDLDRVAALEPDLVVTSDALQAELAADLRERDLPVFHREPATLADVVAGFEALGRAVGRPDAGGRLAAAARDRLEAVAERVPPEPAARPVVYCEEWSDPPMAAGNWVPDAVRAAGGRYPFVDAGERSREVDGDAVAAADPDHAVLHVCGHGDRVDPATIRERDWNLDAAVHTLDDSLLNQPSPRLIDGVERLADLLHGAD